MTEPEQNNTRIFTLALAAELLLLLLALAGVYFLDIPLSLLGSSGYSALVIGVLGALLSFVLILWLTHSDTSVGNTLKHHCVQIHALFRDFSWPQILVVAAAAGICEELFFRGLLQSWLVQLSTPLLGIALASLVFGLMHFVSMTYFVLTLVIGAVLGVTYWLNGSLLGVVVWHFLYDLIAIGVLVKFPHLLGVPLNAETGNPAGPSAREAETE